MEDPLHHNLNDNVPRPRMAVDVFSLLLESVSAGYYDHYMPPGETVLISQSWLDILGLRSQHVPPPGRFRSWLMERVHAEDREKLSAAYDDLLSGRFRSYDMPIRMRHGAGHWIWIQGAVHAAEVDGQGKVRRTIGIIRDITAQKQEEERRDLMIRDLHHRTMNMLAMLQGLANLTFANAADPREGLAAFTARVEAVKAVQGFLSSNALDHVDLAVIAARVAACAGTRIRCNGPSMQLPATLATNLAMALNELCTNAIKYGALSSCDGHVDLVWRISRAAQPSFRIVWQEDGGPPVRAPARRGLGLHMIEDMLAREMDGSVHIDFHPGGLVCEINGPLPASSDDAPRISIAPHVH